MNTDFYFNFSVSVKPYDRNKDNAAFLQWREINGNITTLSDYITQGYAYCNTFYHEEGKTFSNELKKADNAKSANLICLDLDAVKYPYDDFVTLMEQTEIKPNIVYTTQNNGHFKYDWETYNNRYRVIYVVDEPIYNDTLYKAVHQAIKREIELITEDKNVFNDNSDNNISHFFAGAKNTTITTDENIYPLTWLMERYGISADNGNIKRNNNKGESDNHFNNKEKNTTSQSATRNNNKDEETPQDGVKHTYITDFLNKKLNDIESATRYNIKKGEEESIINPFCTFSEEENQFIEDYYNLSFSDLIHKYISTYPSIECTQLEYDDTEEIVTLPSNYTEIKRRWYIEEFEMTNGGIIKWSNVHKTRNGEGRRNLLFKNLLLRKRILPNITFCHLLLNAVYEVHYFINNTDVNDKITKQQIAQITVNAFFADDRMTKVQEKRKYIINGLYCAKHGISKKEQAIKFINEKKATTKQNNMEQMKRLYNKDISDLENVRLLNENGVNISLRTYKQYKKEMGLSKTYNKRSTSAQNTKDNKVIAKENINTQSAKEIPNKSVISDQVQKDNEVFDQQIISAERAQETPKKEVTIKAQEKANKSVVSVENASVEQIPNKEELNAENVKETPKTYYNKYPHLVWINEMICFENMMENANTIQELETLKNNFETKLEGFPQIPQTAEKVVNNSLQSTMAKYAKILESMSNKA